MNAALEDESVVEFLTTKKKEKFPEITVRENSKGNWKVRQRLQGAACLILCLASSLLGDGSILVFFLPIGITLLFSRREIK